MDAADTKKITALWYSDLSTLREQHPELDLDCSMTIEQFSALRAETHTKEKLICQLEKAGNRCNTPFNNGWLALRKDGRKVLIGCDCAEKHFHASDKFRAERNRIGQEIAVQENLVALAELLKDRHALGLRIAKARQQLNDYRSGVRSWSDSLPREVLWRLHDFRKASGDRARIEVEVEYVEIEVDDKGKEKRKVTWQRREIGAVVGLTIWDSNAPIPLATTLHEADIARQEADLRPDQKLPLLKKWRAALDQLPHSEQQIERMHRALADFGASPNVALLCHVVKNEDRQREIVAVVLKRNGEQPNTMRVGSAWNQIRQAVRKAVGDRNFRVAY